MMGVRFSIVSVPMKRRLQTLAVLFHSVLLPGFTLALNLFFILQPWLWFIYLPYVIWLLFFDAASHGPGRPWGWFRRLPVWRYLATYFPAELVKTVDLDPARKYVFAVHPHGIISYGVVCNFFTDSTGFSTKFPGIKLRGLAGPPFFRWPFYREVCLWLGLIDARRANADRALQLGRSVLVVPGGAPEALVAKPAVNKLKINKETGFIRLAMHHNADLVPVFSFGENDIFDQVEVKEGSWLQRAHSAFMRLFFFCVPMIHGRGIFNYDAGFLPFRAPITSVVGAPIKVPHVRRPAGGREAEQHNAEYMAQVQAVHSQYKAALLALYNEHRAKYPTRSQQKGFENVVLPDLEFID